MTFKGPFRLRRFYDSMIKQHSEAGDISVHTLSQRKHLRLENKNNKYHFFPFKQLHVILDAWQADAKSAQRNTAYIISHFSACQLFFTILQNPSQIPVSVEQQTSTSLDLQVSVNRIRWQDLFRNMCL